MTTPLKLAAFAAVLALVFGAAALAGGAVGPLHDPAAATAEDGMNMAADPIRGLALSENGLTLDLARRTAHPDTKFRLDFRILGEDGRAVHNFDLEHTKRMHLIVVRRDLTDFQHLHPTLLPDGTWTTPLTLPQAGTYRVFADFSVNRKPTTLADDLQVDGDVRSGELPAPAKTAQADGFRVRLTDGTVHAGEESELTFDVTRNGELASLQDYLGAKGHLVALREGDLAFLHIHPDASSLRFEATFPKRTTAPLDTPNRFRHTAPRASFPIGLLTGQCLRQEALLHDIPYHRVAAAVDLDLLAVHSSRDRQRGGEPRCSTPPVRGVDFRAVASQAHVNEPMSTRADSAEEDLMGMIFEELDDVTRRCMLEEFEAEELAGPTSRS